MKTKFGYRGLAPPDWKNKREYVIETKETRYERAEFALQL